LIVLRKKRGRKMRTQPTERDKQILKELSQGKTLTELSNYWGVSRQRIHQIRNRWSYGRYKGYKPSIVVEETHTWTSPSE
jgi:hypothetical protein